MTRRHALATCAAACHLLLVVCGATGWAFFGGDPAEDNLAEEAVRLYGALSGAENGYGFFAPGVSSQIRATFTLTDAAGRTWTDTLEEGMGAEATLRVGSGVSLAAFDGVRESLARSWAATMFARHPAARSVTIRIDVYDLPTMTDYRAGARPCWLPVYEATAERDAAPAEETSKP